MRNLACILLAASVCSSAHAQDTPVADRVAKQNALFEEFYQTGLKSSPERATSVGDYQEPKTIPAGQPKIVKTQSTSQYANVHCGLQDKAGNLWFGTTGEGVYRYDGKSFTNLTEKDGLSSNDVWSMYEDKDGNLWFGTGDGVSRYDSSALHSAGSKVFSVLRTTEPLGPSTKNAVWSILQDKTGNFWFGTDEGVFRYDGKSFAHFLRDDGVINNSGLRLKSVQSILEDKNGNIWFASWSREGVGRYDGKSLTSFKPNGDDMVHAILEDKNGNIWFGTRDHGVCRYDGKTFTNFTAEQGLGHSTVYSMLEDKAGNLWFATENGSGEEGEDGACGVSMGNPLPSLQRKKACAIMGFFLL